MTYRERREAKADKLRGWADKREADAGAVLEHNRIYTDDYAFNTQPGHIPLRARVIRQNDRAMESLRKADTMVSRADGIERALDCSIYSDDDDALEQLTERIAKLEQQRESIKAENAAFRKAHKAELAGLSAYQRNQAMPHRGYVLTNLTGNIKRNKDRLVVLKRQQERTAVAEEAGGVAITEQAGGYASVTFADKPERAVLESLKAAGFRWSQGSWWGSMSALPADVAEMAR